MVGPRDDVGGLAALLAEAKGRGHPPVERWNPPLCGDIGLRIRCDGVWLYRGSPIARERLVKLFASVLRRDADGTHYLVTPVEKVPVAVDDAPFLAVEMEVSGAGAGQSVVVRTNVDDVVACGPDHPLRFGFEVPGGGLKPYILVRGRLEALATRAITYELMELAIGHAETTGGRPGIASGGCFFALPEVPDPG